MVGDQKRSLLGDALVDVDAARACIEAAIVNLARVRRSTKDICLLVDADLELKQGRRRLRDLETRLRHGFRDLRDGDPAAGSSD